MKYRGLTLRSSVLANECCVLLTPPLCAYNNLKINNLSRFLNHPIFLGIERLLSIRKWKADSLCLFRVFRRADL